MLDNGNLPAHIAFIMDGNGRWAKDRNLPRVAGHREGIERVREIIRHTAAIGIKFITFFAFSTENWNRPREEVDALMRYLDSFLDSEIKEFQKNNIRFISIGRGDPIPLKLQEKIRRSEEETSANSGLRVVLALNYGGRQEIIDAAKSFASSVCEGKLKTDQLSEELFSSYLYTKDIPDPDILVRTSGEQRISNFLLWQLSYAELYFCPKFWPDFKSGDLDSVINDYQKRERRFGRVDVPKKVF
jgi:undecaprenyl diphosphate synthase